MGEPKVIYQEEDSIASIALNRPNKLNALDVESWDLLRESLERADRNRDIRVIVLSGRGRAFCAGDDIGDFGFDTSGEARSYSRHIMRSGLTIERIETPVISKVDGLAHGGGCELAFLPDVTIATPESSFRLPESLVGAIPGIGLVRLPELIGLKRARELMLTNREFDAVSAEEWGIVNEVVPEDEIDEVVAERADHIATTAPMSSRLIKRICNSRLSDESAGINGLTLIFSMEDAQEGMEAFFEDRHPEWRDR